MKLILFVLVVFCCVFANSQKLIKESKVIFKEDSIAYLKNGEKLTGTLTIERGYLLQKVDYMNGVKSGKHDYYKNGILVKTQTYVDGKQNGPEFKWDSLHVFLIYQWNYLDGKPHGKCIRYYDKSWQIKEVLYCKQGLLDGSYLVYSPKGNMQVEKNYKEGKLHGRWISYNSVSGKKGLVMNFKENKWFGFIEFYDNQESLINREFIGDNENDEIKDWDGNLWVFRNYGAEFWKYYFDKSSKLTSVQYYLPNYLVKEVKIEKNKANLRVDYNNNSPRVEINFDNCNLQFEGYTKEDVCTKDFTRWYKNGQMAEKIIYSNTKYNADPEVNLVKKWYSNGNLQYENKLDSNLIRKWYETGNLRLESGENNITEFYPSGSVKYSLRQIILGKGYNVEYNLKIYDPSGSLIYSYKEVNPNHRKQSREHYQKLFTSQGGGQFLEKTFSENGVIYNLKGIGFTVSINQYTDSSKYLKDTSIYCLWDFLDPVILEDPTQTGFEDDFFSCILPIEYGALCKGVKEGTWVYNDGMNYENSNYKFGLLNGPFYCKIPFERELYIGSDNYSLGINQETHFLGVFENGKIEGKLNGYSEYHRGTEEIPQHYEISDTLDERIIIKIVHNDTLWIKKYTNGKLAKETNYSRNHPEYKVIYNNNSVFYRAKYRENGRKIAETWYKYIFNNPSAEADSLMIYYHPTGNVKAKVFYDSKQKATSTLFDQQGVEIQSVKIGNQIWTTSNLDISDYLNGALLSNSNTDSQWEESFFKRRSAWCYYNNDSSSNYQSKLYNWLVVDNSAHIIPPGWHVPSIKEIKELEKHLGGSQIAGGKLKSNSEWLNGKQGTNLVRFNAVPSGSKGAYGGFYDKGSLFGMWTTEPGEGNGAYIFKLLNSSDSSFLENVSTGDGFVIRLIKD